MICWRYSPLECLGFVQPEDGRTGHSKRTSRFASRWQGFSNGSRVYSISEFCERDGWRHTVRSGLNHEQVNRREGPAGAHRLEQRVCLEDGNASACWSLHLLTLRDSFWPSCFRSSSEEGPDQYGYRAGLGILTPRLCRTYSSDVAPTTRRA